uniref:Tho2 protein, putative n=1 Tax=Arundo donax TaxID=35708 RepID=A0A0A9CJK6_ARUDO
MRPSGLRFSFARRFKSLLVSSFAACLAARTTGFCSVSFSHSPYRR